MARPPKKDVPKGKVVTDADTPQLQQMVETHDALNRQLAVIDQQYGGGDYEIAVYNRERVINECKFFLGQSAQAMLAAGNRLILMKEHEAHGDWMECLRKLNVEPRLAQMMMKAAIKFNNPNAKSISHLEFYKVV